LVENLRGERDKTLADLNNQQKKKFNDLKEKYERLETKLKDLKTSNNEKMNDYDNKINTLNEELKEQRDSNETLKDRLFKAEIEGQNNLNKESILNQALEKNNELLHKIEKLESSVNELFKSNENYKQQVLNLTKETDAITETRKKITKLEGLNANMEKTNRELTDAINSLKDEKNKLEKELSTLPSLKFKIKELEEELQKSIKNNDKKEDISKEETRTNSVLPPIPNNTPTPLVVTGGPPILGGGPPILGGGPPPPLIGGGPPILGGPPPPPLFGSGPPPLMGNQNQVPLKAMWKGPKPDKELRTFNWDKLPPKLFKTTIFNDLDVNAVNIESEMEIYRSC